MNRSINISLYILRRYLRLVLSPVPEQHAHNENACFSLQAVHWMAGWLASTCRSHGAHGYALSNDKNDDVDDAEEDLACVHFQFAIFMEIRRATEKSSSLRASVRQANTIFLILSPATSLPPPPLSR